MTPVTLALYLQQEEVWGLSQFENAQAKRALILREVAALRAQLGFSPTPRQVADRCKMSRSLLDYHLASLIADGLIAIEQSTTTVPCTRILLLDPAVQP